MVPSSQGRGCAVPGVRRWAAGTHPRRDWRERDDIRQLPAPVGTGQLVAERESLSLRTVESDAADLSISTDESFDLVFNPVSTVLCKTCARCGKKAIAFFVMMG